MSTDTTLSLWVEHEIDEALARATTQFSAARVADEMYLISREARVVRHQTLGLMRSASLLDLDEHARVRAQDGVARLLTEIADSGLAWRDAARIIGVSVPAIQKWRRGERATGQNLQRLARVVALLELLRDGHHLTDVVSWLEMPVRRGVALSHLDLIAAGREDLVLNLVRDDDAPASVDEVLSEYDPDWRTSLVDDDFETFVAPDGVVSIRPRGR